MIVVESFFLLLVAIFVFLLSAGGDDGGCCMLIVNIVSGTTSKLDRITAEFTKSPMQQDKTGKDENDTTTTLYFFSVQIHRLG